MKTAARILCKIIILSLFITTQCILAADNKTEKVTDNYLDLYRKFLSSVYQENIKRLIENKDEIIGLEVIIASGTDEQIFSKYGHALIRFVNKNGLWANDIMISFVADIDTAKVDYARGLNGGYKVAMEALTVHQYWNQYIVQGGRSLSRYIIPTSKVQILNVINQVQKRLQDPSSLGGYKFLTKNCASLLSQLLIDSGFPYSTNRTNVPTSIPSWLDSSLVNIYPKIEVKSKKDIFDRAIKMLNISQENFERGKDWPENAAEVLLDNLNASEIKIIYNEVVMIPLDVYATLIKKVNYNSGQSFDQVFGFEKIDSRLYKTCQDVSCVSEIRGLEQSIWSPITLENRQKQLNFIKENFTIAENKNGVNDHEFNLVELQKNLTQYNSFLLFINNP